LIVANKEVGNVLGERDCCLGIQLHRLVHRQRNLARDALRGSHGDLQSLKLAGSSKAGLIKTQAVVDEGIVDHDLLGFHILPFSTTASFDHQRLGSRRRILLSCAVAFHGEGKLPGAARTQLNCVAGLALLQGHETAEAEDPVDDAAGEMRRRLAWTRYTDMTEKR